MWIEGKLDIVGAIALGFAILHVSRQNIHFQYYKYNDSSIMLLSFS